MAATRLLEAIADRSGGCGICGGASAIMILTTRMVDPPPKSTEWAWTYSPTDLGTHVGCRAPAPATDVPPSTYDTYVPTLVAELGGGDL